MKRIIIALLLMSMLITLTVSCASEKDTSQTSVSVNDNALGNSEGTDQARIDPGLPAKNFDGYNFRVLTKGATNAHWTTKDIAAEEENGEPINDAVYKRNSVIGERYNFTVEDVPPANFNDIPTQASNAVLSGDNEFDMFSFNVSSLINNGYLYNLYDIPYINLAQPYYDQNMIESLTMADQLYSVVGEMIIMDNEATIGTIFNKKLAGDYGIETKYGTDLYGIVENGKWHLDTFNEIAALVSTDLNGDGKMSDLEDQWGFQTEIDNVLLMFLGAGGRQAELDSSGRPVSTLFSEKVNSIVNKVHEIQSAPYSLNATTISSNYDDVWSEVMDKNFTEGRALFSIAGLNRVSLFRSMEVDFGILPIPKYDEAQENYCCPIDYICASYIAVPATADNTERTGIIIEALSCESMYVLTPAFYDITLEGKALRDNESSAMLDLIFANRVFDLGAYFNWGQVSGVFYESETFASELASKENTILSDINETIKIFFGE
nr:extracellular solute-binding protein [Clostridia bacterium]